MSSPLLSKPNFNQHEGLIQHITLKMHSGNMLDLMFISSVSNKLRWKVVK